jgi:hypothetical protein
MTGVKLYCLAWLKFTHIIALATVHIVDATQTQTLGEGFKETLKIGKNLIKLE